MITLKFPALQKALTKDVKDLDEHDPRRGIIVLDNTAIVFHDLYCLMLNLYDYFTIESGIEDDLELEELDMILNYLDSKVISKEFWIELTKGSNMSVQEGNLLVENPKYSKDLHYKDANFDLIEPLREIITATDLVENNVSCIGLPFVALNQIYSVLSSDFKSDQIILEFSDLDKPVKFTFRKRKHFYGFIYPHYDSTQEGFRFDCLGTFKTGVTGYLEQLEEEKVVEAPPTEAVKIEEVEQDPAQLKIVED